MTFEFILPTLLSLGAAWYLVKPHIAAETELFSQTTSRKNTLLEEKERLVQILRDLELDHDTHKLSDDEFEIMNRQIRAELAGTLEKLKNESSKSRSS